MHLDLCVNKSSDVLEPSKVLLLLLGIDVIRDKGSQSLVDATLLEEALHQHLQVLVEAAEGRSGVDVGTLLGGLGGVDASNLGVLVEEHVVDLDLAIAGGGIDVEGAVGLAGLLDQDGEVDGCASLLIDITLEAVVGVLLLVGLEGLLGELILLEHVLGVGVEVGDVGDGEANGDPEGKLLVNLRHGASVDLALIGDSLLFAVAAGQLDDLLARSIDQLEWAVVEEVLDARRLLLIGLDILLDLDLALQLGRESLVDLDIILFASTDGG